MVLVLIINYNINTVINYDHSQLDLSTAFCVLNLIILSTNNANDQFILFIDVTSIESITITDCQIFSSIKRIYWIFSTNMYKNH